jgi:ADP-ribose pyrophosphatase YjhB (NUDIX family)
MDKIGNFGVAAKAVVMRGDKVLLMKRTDYQPWNAHQWDIPGGRLAPGETIKKALLREITKTRCSRLSST